MFDRQVPPAPSGTFERRMASKEQKWVLSKHAESSESLLIVGIVNERFEKAYSSLWSKAN